MDSNLEKNSAEVVCEDLKRIDLKEKKNWSDLPVEMKLECIKRMDLETRLSLCATSRSEKELAESTRCWNEVLEIRRSFFMMDAFTVSIMNGSGGFTIDMEDRSTLESVLKIGVIGFLELDCDSTAFRALLYVSQTARLEIRELYLECFPKSDIQILNKCRGLEYIQITFQHAEEVKFADLNAIFEIIFDAKYVQLLRIHSVEPDEIIEIMEKWVEDDKEAKSVFCIHANISADVLDAKITEEFRYLNPRRTSMLVDDQKEQFYIPMGRQKYLKCSFTNYDVYLEVVCLEDILYGDID